MADIARKAFTLGTMLTPRMAIGIVFLCFGLSIGLWGGSVAEVSRFSSVSAATLGSAFVGFGAAGALGMAISGRIGKSISLKNRLVALIAAMTVSEVFLLHAGSVWNFISLLCLFSFLGASIDLVMNSEALAVEKDLARPVLAGFHGFASLGIGFASIAGSYLSVTFGVTVTAIVSVLVSAVSILSVLHATPDRGATQPIDAGSTWFRPSLALILLALIVGVSTSGEIASTMFSAKTLASQAPQLAAYAGTGAMAFALCQSAVRLTGDRLRHRMGDDRLIRVSLATALAGAAIVASSTGFVQTSIGFAVVGIGTACIVPCGFALAARVSTMPAAAAISMLAMIGAGLRIGSPLLYGEIAEVMGYARAFSIYAVLFLLALGVALLGQRNSIGSKDRAC